MSSGILQLCVISMLCGAVLSIVPEGGIKRVTGILCTAVLTIAVLSPLAELDMDIYALESAKLKELEETLLNDSKKAEEKLNRLYIQQEYEEYIKDKAQELGINEPEVSVLVQWNPDGVWVPYSAQLHVHCNKKQADELGRIILDELGVPYERQLWYSD